MNGLAARVVAFVVVCIVLVRICRTAARDMGRTRRVRRTGTALVVRRTALRRTR